MPPDHRPALYHDLHGRQLTAEEDRNRLSAERILAILCRLLQPRSLLDVGCGLGTWLHCAAEMGIGDLQGIEGPWFESATARIDPAQVMIHDLEQDFDLGRRFDVVTCLEVAEHLSAAVAERFVATLVRHGPAATTTSTSASCPIGLTCSAALASGRWM